jgi:hypothetical protein
MMAAAGVDGSVFSADCRGGDCPGHFILLVLVCQSAILTGNYILFLKKCQGVEFFSLTFVIFFVKIVSTLLIQKV